jgi:hypothetical protein
MNCVDDKGSMKTQVMWAIKHLDHDYIHAVREYRSEAIDAFVPLLPGKSWKYWYRRGYRAIRVVVSVL